MNAIQLPLIFQDSMVLQRKKPVCVWGKASPGKLVQVSLGTAAALAQVSEDGHWKAYLPAMETARGLSLKISCGDAVTEIHDVAVGEVWIAGGQSNMEFLLKHDAEAAQACQMENPDVRCFEVPKISFPGQEQYYKMSDAGFWRKECPKDSPEFTAVGFYFANRIWETLRVPVGIINCTWGGTSASCWVAEEYLTGELQFYLDRAREVQSAMDYDKELPNYIAIQKRILNSNIDMGRPNLAPVEPLIDEETHQRLMTMNNWPFSAFRPCGLYELMVKTIVPYTVSGVIWYQGESDEYFSEHYESAMRAVVQCWRDSWNESIPFLMVQLAAFEVMAEYLDFVPIRKAQERLARTEPGVYLVTAMDVGMQYDIHPKEKRPVGTRLALQALDKVYHCHLLADSPTVQAVERQGSLVRIRMKHTGQGLWVKGENPVTFDVFYGGAALQNFKVEVSPWEILLRAEEFGSGKLVKIGFCQRPYCALNIYNSSGLPVLPFEVEA